MKELDPLLHSQLRLAIVSILLSVKEADFAFLKEKTEATSGNLSVQIEKLAEAGYIAVRKEIVGKNLAHPALSQRKAVMLSTNILKTLKSIFIYKGRDNTQQ